MASKKSFYEADSYNGTLREGLEITVRHGIRYLGENADFKPFLTVPHKELEQQLKDSSAEEKKIFESLKEAIKAWEEHGARTLLLQKAIEYVKTPEVQHTANEWKQQEDGSWEISNMVYKMTFRITGGGAEWKLAWELQYTAPGQKNQYYSYYNTGPKKRIEYEGSKKYKTMAGAQNYIQSKFDQYAEFFETLSPPVPPEVKSLFCVNGQLLQGYTLAKEKTAAKEEKLSLDDLLTCLEDGDVEKSPPESAQEQAAPPPSSPASKAPPQSAEKPAQKAPKPSKHASKGKKPVKQQSAPVR